MGSLTTSTGNVPYLTIAVSDAAPVHVGATNQLGYYSSNTAAISGLPNLADGVLVTDDSGVPSISSTLPISVMNNITQLGIINANTIFSGNISSPKTTLSGEFLAPMFTLPAVDTGGNSLATAMGNGVQIAMSEATCIGANSNCRNNSYFATAIMRRSAHRRRALVLVRMCLALT